MMKHPVSASLLVVVLLASGCFPGKGLEFFEINEADVAEVEGADYQAGHFYEIGSIVTGGKADFTAVDRGPWEVGAGGMKDRVVQGTVFEGRAFPLSGDR